LDYSIREKFHASLFYSGFNCIQERGAVLIDTFSSLDFSIISLNPMAKDIKWRKFLMEVILVPTIVFNGNRIWYL
jgi:hypothetical protein